MGLLTSLKRFVSSFMSLISLPPSTANTGPNLVFRHSPQTTCTDELLGLLESNTPLHFGCWLVRNVSYYKYKAGSQHEYLVAQLELVNDQDNVEKRGVVRLERGLNGEREAKETTSEATHTGGNLLDGAPDDGAVTAVNPDRGAMRPPVLHNDNVGRQEPSAVRDFKCSSPMLNTGSRVQHSLTTTPLGSDVDVPTSMTLQPLSASTASSSPQSRSGSPVPVTRNGRPTLIPSISSVSHSSESFGKRSAADQVTYQLGDHITSQPSECLMQIDFERRHRFPLEQLLTMASVLSHQSTKYNLVTTQCYWFAGMLWDLILSEKIGEWKRIKPKPSKSKGRWWGIPPSMFAQLPKEHRLPALSVVYEAEWSQNKKRFDAAKEVCHLFSQ